jgi:hypothetical protein
MLRRVLEGAVVAAVASVVTLFITDRPDLEDASAVFTTDLLRGLTAIGARCSAGSGRLPLSSSWPES